MAQTLTIGTPPIDVTLRRSARARRISLRVSGLDGRVSITLPTRGSLREAETFLRQKEPWIRKHLDNAVTSTPIEIGASVMIEGDPYTIAHGTSRRITLDGDTLHVPATVKSPANTVRAYLKLLARDRLMDASQHYAAQIHREVGKLTLRDTRSRWGSCSSQGGLMYSWRLIMAPPQVLRYVAAHEVAHLLEMNHSPAFWAHVETLMPDYATHRAWLRTDGATLHRYTF